LYILRSCAAQFKIYSFVVFVVCDLNFIHSWQPQIRFKIDTFMVTTL
ncbi:unnamed protein product, partial [Rotaria magnacalcarata]